MRRRELVEPGLWTLLFVISIAALNFTINYQVRTANFLLDVSFFSCLELMLFNLNRPSLELYYV